MEQELTPQEWKQILTVMVKYKSNFNIARSCLDYMTDHPSATPTEKQQMWIWKIWNGSKEQKQFEKDKQAQANKSFSQQIEDKLPETRQGNMPTSIFEIKKYSSSIQAKQDNLPPQPNKYTLDTSNDNIKKTRLELFDQLFADDDFDVEKL